MDDSMLGQFDPEATVVARKDNTLLGNVLAIGSRLVAEGAIPEDVVEGKDGSYALCLVTHGGSEVRALHAGGEIEVGREAADGGGWKVNDPWMSRRHFRVSVDPEGRPWLCCLGAKNGTFVNDRVADSHTTLRRGDVVRAGNSSFLVL